MNINELANELQQPTKVILAKAKGCGYSGGVDGELPADIAQAIRGGPRQIGSAPATSETTEPQPEPTKKQGQGLHDIHQASVAGAQFLSDSLLDFELDAAKAEGTMAANQIFLHREVAKNQRLRDLEEKKALTSQTRQQTRTGSYYEDVETLRQKTLREWAHSDKTGKTLQQAAAEMRALRASFDI